MVKPHCKAFFSQDAFCSYQDPRDEGIKFPDLEKEFEPNLINSTVYIISMALQVATFAINYKGHPFMESIRENRPLMISLVGTYSFIVFLALGWSSDLCEQFGIVQFPEEFRSILLQVLMLDFMMSLLLDRICSFLLGEGKLRQRR